MDDITQRTRGEEYSENRWHEILSTRYKTVRHPWGVRGPDFICNHRGYTFAIEVEQRRSHWDDGDFPFLDATLHARRFVASKKWHLPFIFFSSSTSINTAVMIDVPFQWDEIKVFNKFSYNTGQTEEYFSSPFTQFSTKRLPRQKIEARIDDWFKQQIQIGWFPD